MEHESQTGTEPSNNIHLHGYNEFIFAPTNSIHGEIGFYIKENITYFERNDLDMNSTSDYETKFIEIRFEKPLIIGCVYRHPSSIDSITDFSTIHVEPILTRSQMKIRCVSLNCQVASPVQITQGNTTDEAKFKQRKIYL